MNDNQKYWYSIWRLVAITVCILIVSISGCVANDRRVVTEMVKNGADPMAAYCSLGVNGSLDAVLCAQAIASK
jgi:hypothetical protein